MIGLGLAISLMALQQEDVPADLSPPTIQALDDWEQCITSNISRVSQSSDSAEVAADGLLEYCRDQQRTARAAILLDFTQRMGAREGEETTNSLEAVLVMRARQNTLIQIAAARQK